MKLFIGTPLTIRPTIHKKAFTSYKEFILYLIKILEPIDIIWIINIDIINNIEYDYNIYEKTEKIITDIYSDIVKIKFNFIRNKDGNFLRAVNNITSFCCENGIKQNDLFFYLEDDWFIENNEYKKNISDIFNFIANYKEKCEFAVSSIGSFSPFICNYEFFKYYNKLYKKNKKNPEKISRHNIIYDIVKNKKKLFIYNLMFDSKKKNNKFINNNNTHIDSKYTLKFIKNKCREYNEVYDSCDTFIKTYNFYNLYNYNDIPLSQINYFCYNNILFKDIGR